MVLVMVAVVVVVMFGSRGDGIGNGGGGGGGLMVCGYTCSRGGVDGVDDGGGALQLPAGKEGVWKE